MENICEWQNCNEIGKFKAPQEKDNSCNDPAVHPQGTNPHTTGMQPHTGNPQRM